MVDCVSNIANGKKERGFTLFEVLIVIGMFSVLSSAALFIDLNTYRGDALRDEQQALMTLLQRARADAMNNLDGQPHGVALQPSGYDGWVLFTGESYDVADHSHDERVSNTSHLAIASSSPTELVFEQLSGAANYDGVVTLVDREQNKTTSIVLNHEGNISE